MSEPNPPTGQPTPPPDEPTQPIQPAEGVGPTASEEAAPPPPPADETSDAPTPPPPGTPDETAVDGDTPPPPPPANKSKAPWIIGVAILLVLVLIGGAVAVIVSITGEDKHSIATPSSAGGMKRDTAKETELKAQLEATAKQFETQFKGISVKHALYNQNDSDRGPEGPLLFLGLKFKTASEKNPASFVKQFDKVAAANKLKITKVSAGEGGGRAICIGADAAQSATCLWVTQDSAGGVFPNVAGFKTDQLAKLMRDVREDVETTD